jgi:hypothetical protein
MYWICAVTDAVEFCDTFWGYVTIIIVGIGFITTVVAADRTGFVPIVDKVTV